MRFDYLEAKTIDQAISLLGQYDGRAKIIAGGTDLWLKIRNKAIKPEYVIDITSIPNLNYIDYSGHYGLKIGALTTIRELETSIELQKRHPIISQAASQLGSVAIRNVATIGGNLCNALPSAEMAQPLIALSAQLIIAGPGGERIMPLENFFTGVGKTALGRSELLVEIEVPPLLPETKGLYIKHSVRGTIDLAIVNLAIVITLEPENKTCNDIRIVMGSVAETPIRAQKAEKVLRGLKIDSKLIDKAAQVASDEAHPRTGSIRGSVEYKKEMIKVFTRRALGELTAL